MPNHHLNVVLPLQGFDLQTVLERIRDRLLRVDVLASHGDLFGNRQVLFVGDGKNDALDLRVVQQCVQGVDAIDTKFLLIRLALFHGATEATDNLELVRLLCGAAQDLGPSTQADDTNFHRFRTHSRDLCSDSYYGGQEPGLIIRYYDITI